MPFPAPEATTAIWPRILAAAADAAPESPVAWPAVIDAAEAHGMAAALAVRIRQAGLAASLDAGSSQRLDALYRTGVLRALQRQAVLQQVLDALARAGIVPVAYKGAALAFLHYAEPSMRPMSDLDLWVEHDEMPRAKAALAALGFVHRASTASRPDRYQAGTEGEVQMRHPRMGLVELHWGVFPGEWLSHATTLDRAAVRRRVTTTQVLGRPIRVLAPPDHLLHVVLHAAISNRHSSNAVRCLLDVVLLADTIDDWPGLLKMVRHGGVARVFAHALHLAGTLFARPHLLRIAADLRRQHSIRALLAHVDAGDVLARRRALGAVRRWTFLLCAVDRPAHALALVRHTVWPDLDWLQLRYGERTVRRRLAHLADAVRGRI